MKETTAKRIRRYIADKATNFAPPVMMARYKSMRKSSLMKKMKPLYEELSLAKRTAGMPMSDVTMPASRRPSNNLQTRAFMAQANEPFTKEKLKKLQNKMKRY